MSFPLTSLGGLDEVGKGSYGNASATSKSGDVWTAVRNEIPITEGAGNRAFQNFVTFPGASQTLDATNSNGVNGVRSGIQFNKAYLVVGLAAATLVLLLIIRR